MSDQILVGIDAGTSLIKSVAFDRYGKQIASSSRPNEFNSLPNGGVEQDMRLTWEKTAQTLQELSTLVPDLAQRIMSIAVTGQGDGTWLVDEAGEPVHDAWLWLDARSTSQARAIEQSARYDEIVQLTGTGVNVCQMRTQLRWIKENTPELLNAASTSYHCKDYLYHKLTGVRATDPSEGVFTFGDYKTRDYSPKVIDALDLTEHKDLFPPIVDGVKTSHELSASAAQQTGLPTGTPVILGYVDVMCSALGGGLLDASVSPGITILGTTGMHMRYCSGASEVRLNSDKTGYTMSFPDGGYAQMQSNMAATMNIDWMLDVARDVLSAQGVEKERGDLLRDLDEQVMAADAAAALYHPYISTAGERGPFINPDARASFVGLDQSVGYFDMVRAVFEGLALAARDCYCAMGELPEEIRVSGGAAKSAAMLQILASVLNRPVRVVDSPEAGATGVVMMSAVQQQLYTSLAECAEHWVNPAIGNAVLPDPALLHLYDDQFAAYVEVREKMATAWSTLGNARRTFVGDKANDNGSCSA